MPGKNFRYVTVVLLILLQIDLFAQDSFRTEAQDSVFSNVNSSRIKLVAGGHIVAYGGSLVALSTMWYSKQPRSSFHFFDDNSEWLQVDKVGHFYTAYEVGRMSHALWEWAGLDNKKAAWIGGMSGLAFQTIIEVLDAFSDEYGFSVGDYAANATGTALFISQQLGWKEQRFKLKFSSLPRSYASADLKQRADDVYGPSFAEKLLKDYNHQTYWLSADIKALTGSQKWPAWLNIAIGYGADGMFGARTNIARYPDYVFDRSDIPRRRQWYLSPDVNFSRIKTRKKGVRTLLFLLDALKFPAPALELSQGKIKGHFVFF